jgi:carboxypeptidase C (cathepsin A)
MLFLLGCAILASLILSPSFAHYGSSNNTELPTRNDFRVRNLDQVVPDYALFEGEMYAGSLPIGNNHNRDERNEERKGALMFWLFAPYQPLVEDSLTLALNGGPGCSSLLAFCMFETGPVTVPLHPAGWCCLEEDAPLTYNEFAWTNVTAMLYVEQPVGVGYSVGEPEPQNEEELSGDFFVFLQNFYTVFQEFQDKRLFLVGESYAGMYVPSIAHKIHTEMQKLITNTATDDSMSIIPINLAGLGLGNAWVDAKIQGPATIDYAYWHGMIDEHTRDNLHAEWRHCMEKGPSSREHAPFHSFNTPDDCAMMTGTLMAAGQGAWKERPSGPVRMHGGTEGSLKSRF